EDWPALKPNTPLGQLPYLDIDDLKVPQSSAINHYLAREFGLLGSNNLEEVQINVVYETLIDISKYLTEFYTIEDEKEKDEWRAKFVSERLNAQSKLLVGLLEKNNGDR
ncbi:hypothetical protein, partial [Salmonella sp. s55004]|uniref:hypothetical protein n=1 Tax=Salmonella sp. s55004 TaxID=3159675 RepID=UPI0039801165